MSSPQSTSIFRQLTGCLGTRRQLLTWTLTAVFITAISSTTDADLASNYYVGTYSAGARRGVVTVQLVERLPSGGYIGWTTVDGISYLGNIFINGNTVDITWYAASGNYQVPLGTIQGTASTNGQTISGRFRHGIRVGTCRLNAA